MTMPSRRLIMHSHIGNRYPTISLLHDWIIFFFVKLTPRPMHRAIDIAARVALSGNPAGS
jgi:hypothetical protein